jgi:hypothetical protein
MSWPRWSRTIFGQIRKQLDTVVSPKSKLTKAVRKPKATWVDPVFIADVEYRDITSEGLLRQSSFKGLKRNWTPELEQLRAINLGSVLNLAAPAWNANPWRKIRTWSKLNSGTHPECDRPTVERRGGG